MFQLQSADFLKSSSKPAYQAACPNMGFQPDKPFRPAPHAQLPVKRFHFYQHIQKKHLPRFLNVIKLT